MNVNSSYWIDLDNFDPKDPHCLAKVKLGISKFVNILCEKSIPVEFKDKDSTSYTDGEVVVIGSDITSENLDSVVGLALHEASHILLTDFSFWKMLQVDLPRKPYSITSQYHIDLIMNLVNFIEDRRIDNFVYKNAPGYRGYYDSLYERYFYNKKIDKLLQSDKGTDPNNIDDYMFRIINIFNSNSDLTTLPALKEIYDIIDIDNIGRLKSVEDSTEVALKIYDLIKHCPIESEQETKNDGSDSGEKNGKGQETDKDIKRIVESQKDFLNGDIKKTKLSQKLSKEVKNEVKKEIEAQDIIDAGEEIIVTTNWKKYFYSKREEIASQNGKKVNPQTVGFNLGKKLLNQLSFTRDVRSDRLRNLEKGKFDSKSAYKLDFDKNIFYRVDTNNPRKTLLYITLDLSGSMRGIKLQQTLITMYSLAYISCFLDNFDVVVTFRGSEELIKRDHSVRSRDKKELKALLAYAFDSRKDSFNKLKLIKGVAEYGGTPEGICYEPLLKDMVKNTDPNTDVYMLNISDGMPSWSDYKGMDGIDYTRYMSNKIKRSGIKVLSYYVEGEQFENFKPSTFWKGAWHSTQDTFKFMYGKGACYIDINNISQVSKTINNLLIDKAKK